MSRRLLFTFGLSLILLGNAVALRSHPAVARADAASLGLLELTVQVSEDRFILPGYIEAGRTLISLENIGAESRHSFLTRLPDDLTIEAILPGGGEEGPPAWLFDSSFPGFPGETLPGETRTAIVDLTPGLYVIIDDFSALFVVNPAPNETASPVASATIVADTTLRAFEFDFAFDMDPAAGKQLIEFVNAGRVPHEALIVRAPDGVTNDQIMEYFMSEDGTTASGLSEDDLTPVGGVGWLSQGSKAWFEVDLEPGTYVLLCFVFDPGAMMPHAMEGMIRVFTII